MTTLAEEIGSIIHRRVGTAAHPWDTARAPSLTNVTDAAEEIAALFKQRQKPMRSALTRLVAHKDSFDQSSSGNQADAYYCLVKGCDADWKAARAALEEDG